MDTIQLPKGGLEAHVFNGRVVDTMSKLLEAGLEPASAADVMRYRIAAWESGDNTLARQWGHNYFDSGSTIMYHSDGRVKVVPNSRTLRDVNPESSLGWCGSLELPQGTFDSTEGVEFSRDDVKRYANKPVTKKEVVENPFWLALAGDDQDLLNRYTREVFSRLGSDTGMTVRIFSDAPERGEYESLCCLDSLGYHGGVYGYIDGRLGTRDCRRVGVAPEAREAFLQADLISRN